MIKIPSPQPTDAERALILSYAPAFARHGVSALLVLDDTLSAIVRTTREPLVGQMRLTWWYEALGSLDIAPPPAEPVLRALYETVLPSGVTGAMLAAMTDGWEALLEQILDDAAIARFAVDRGRRLFDLAGRLLAVEANAIGLAGEGWALADLSRRLTDRDRGTAIAIDARDRLDAALRGRWSSKARALGAMALLARFDVMTPPVFPGSPKRTARLLMHRLTGY